MANSKHHLVPSLFIALFCASTLLQADSAGLRVPLEHHNLPTGRYPVSSTESESKLKYGSMRDDTKRSLIGSVAPKCTYECRNCKYRCRAEQVPVEGNDPMNSAYHYKCICHR